MADIDESKNINRNSSSGIIMKLFGATITVKEKSSHHPNNDHHHHHRLLHHHHDQEDKRSSPSDPISAMADKRPDKIIPCPRCKSMETKFCYFNNYNVNQPRHFCKGCQRYWTAGGALRNVPVGAGRRKVKPPCRGVTEGCMFGGLAEVEQLDYYEAGVVDMEGWYVVEDGGLRHLFPAKRRRCGSNYSQSC